MERYRLYVDESGDHTFSDLADPDRRYLGLTGVVVKSTDYRSCFHPALGGLKQSVFPHDPDDPVILVRNKIVRREGIFARLLDPSINSLWEESILEFFSCHLTRIFTVVIDKKAHFERYGFAAFHPYHYCLAVLLELYRAWLIEVGGKSDVLAEGRGGAEDMELKEVYRGIMENGTRYRSAQEMKDYFTSQELKLKKKSQNISGLQIADLVAYPSKVDVLIRSNAVLARPPARFTSFVNGVLGSKYNEYGRVFLG